MKRKIHLSVTENLGWLKQERAACRPKKVIGYHGEFGTLDRVTCKHCLKLVHKWSGEGL